MARNIPNSFDRVFVRPSAQADETETPPSIHELFTAFMRDELSLPDFAEALDTLHSTIITPAAARLLTSPDGMSGQLSFQQFQRALQDIEGPSGGAGRPMVISDQASAIISDNTGPPAPRKPPSQLGAARPSTDISKDPFIKQQVRLERAAQKGPFPGNPVVQTNHVSAGNPLTAILSGEQAFQAGQENDAYSTREMANTVTRMYVGGEISRLDYEGFLNKSGVQLGAESELLKLIINNEKVGVGNFSQFMRALNRELANA
jgi:hypothetical protein